LTTASVGEFQSERALIAGALLGEVPRYVELLHARLAEAIRYALAGEGKRLRGILFLASYRAAGGSADASLLAAAIEIVHAYSLVHDDLPCMDDDAMRRGRPALHAAYDVRTATAAGLAMVPLAARVAFDGARAVGLDDTESASVVRELMHASGAAGMVGGQLLDLSAEGRELTLGEMEHVHSLKTGALITASARLGGLAARANPAALGALEAYGRAVGLAFQIADDVLDVTSTTDLLGKTAGKDLVFKKSTYPALLGVDGAMSRANDLVSSACDGLQSAGLLTPALESIAQFAIRRKN